MQVSTHIILSLISYKLASLVVGSVFAHMGYRLFMSGIWGSAGELEASFADNKLIFKKAAPGTFFAVFGALIIAITLYKGLEFENYTKGKESFVEIAEEGDTSLPDAKKM